MKKLKKFGFLVLGIVLLAVPLSSVSFADSLQLISSEEGIGINVDNPSMQKSSTGNQKYRAYRLSRSSSLIDGKKVSVSGGKLWAQWRNGVDFRAKYDHNKKIHRCSAMNATGFTRRSDWEQPGFRAVSGWVDQSLYGNRVFAKTK
ncbi:MAG: hypothetical protein KZY61_04890 [Clostridiaceae bacterium]|uniref:Lactococcin 972 family bacteriocin n=1 Tax=Anaerosalibacter bizertensis TaxID=932217 RepID=A0A9Q4ABW1_9FIRM|nr:hypothetical protein [Anaerosalibacter bizertensis]MBV1817889.1 hypothetical protein [Bacteroidales bacterium MSK.15.36]MBW4829653.1 hypothetical protein [Clostridiaceae bacterium]MBW4858563.1 hypothetical protein [Clostridiaceae bacterium]MBW4867811.1 hypothetical protein [Clostridiaceae bacterium]MBW4867998.1 hypothetical protein [Clostridiaceae bacterium]